MFETPATFAKFYCEPYEWCGASHKASVKKVRKMHRFTLGWSSRECRVGWRESEVWLLTSLAAR
jgi:hypothetical protein